MKVWFYMMWIFEKFRGDGAIYAICPKCGFHYASGSTLEMDAGLRQYRYCPMCGEFLLNPSEEIEVTWNERDMMVLYDSE